MQGSLDSTVCQAANSVSVTFLCGPDFYTQSLGTTGTAYHPTKLMKIPSPNYEYESPHSKLMFHMTHSQAPLELVH